MDLHKLFSRLLNICYIQIQENAASYYADVKGDTLELFFEHSNGKTDWKNNFDFPAKPYREMQDLWFVHRGFLRVWKTIEPRIEALVANRRIRHIVVAGYSHGAALALLCHEYCVFHRPDIAWNIEGYGFGCPRVVWGPLKKSLQVRFENFTVVRNHSDLVTHLPPAIFGFHHVGKLLRVGKKQKGGPVKSHYPERYLAALEEYGRAKEK